MYKQLPIFLSLWGLSLNFKTRAVASHTLVVHLIHSRLPSSFLCSWPARGQALLSRSSSRVQMSHAVASRWTGRLNPAPLTQSECSFCSKGHSEAGSISRWPPRGVTSLLAPAAPRAAPQCSPRASWRPSFLPSSQATPASDLSSSTYRASSC